MVENQRNSCRFPYFDNAYFKPSKMELVLNVAKESSFSLTVCKLQVIQWVHFLNLKSCDILRDLFRDFWLHYCHNQTVKLWKYHFERVCQSLSVGFEGEGFQDQASVSPYFFMGVTKIMMDCVGSNVSIFNRLWVWEILYDSEYNWYGANNGLSGNKFWSF